jgi:4-alpha-glucanotransferase
LAQTSHLKRRALYLTNEVFYMKSADPSRRQSGIVAPLSAIRSDTSLGCGEFPDLERLGDLAAAWGFHFIQLLPVNDSGFQNSPYFALSAFALHPIYLKIGDLPEISEAAGQGGAGAATVGAAAAAKLRSEAEGLIQDFAA